MNIKYFLKFCLFYFKVYLIKIYLFFYPKIIEPTQKDNNIEYYEKMKQLLYDKLENKSRHNTNTIEEFYDIDKLNKYVNDNTEYETLWKSRMLFTNTPNGNLIMYYDPYRCAFVYYSDIIHPIQILDASSIKYVLTYNCIDLYANEFDLKKYTNTHLNALIKYNSYTKPKNDNNLKHDSGVFIKKKKNENKPEKKTESNENNWLSSFIINTKKEEDTNKEDTKKEYFNNKYIYGGKITGFNILKKSVIYPTNFKSPLLDSISNNDNRVSYKDFKNKFTLNTKN